MYRILVFFAAMAVSACHYDHSHDEAVTEAREEVKFQFTAYSSQFELFAEADPFIAGEPANVLSHFSTLPDFQAVESGIITLVLEAGGEEIRQTLEKPTRKGIYSFDIKPVISGQGRIKFEIANEMGDFEVIVPEVKVFPNDEEALATAQQKEISHTNTTVFTKEESWKIDFSTGHPEIRPFGQVIRTTGLLEPAPGSEAVITAKTAGIVSFSENTPMEGLEVRAGQTLIYISGSGFADENFSVRYAEAKNNYEKAKADLDRSEILAEDKIIAEKDLLSVRNEYENARAVFENLSRNFNASGQVVNSPVNGFIRDIQVKSGSYVTAGEALLTVFNDNDLVISAEVPQKYATLLGLIQTANIRNPQEDKTWTLEELGGEVLSYGKSTKPDSYLVPIRIGIRNTRALFPGSIVELFLQTVSDTAALTVPMSALLEEQGKYFVWVQVTPELFEKREITPGKTDGLHTEILGRLSITDRIVTRGALMVKLAQATGTLDAHSGHVH